MAQLFRTSVQRPFDGGGKTMQEMEQALTQRKHSILRHLNVGVMGEPTEGVHCVQVGVAHVEQRHCQGHSLPAQQPSCRGR